MLTHCLLLVIGLGTAKQNRGFLTRKEDILLKRQVQELRRDDRMQVHSTTVTREKGERGSGVDADRKGIREVT